MAPRLLRLAEYQRQEWRNGGGTTAEIWRERSSGDEFMWRLSMADVASDGAFSVFPDIDRHIILVHGKGMVLQHAGLPTHLLDRLFVPHAFPGDVATNCHLINGPCRDLNLMIRRDLGSGRLEIVRLAAGAQQALIDRSSVALFVLEGKVAVTSQSLEIEAADGDTVLLDKDGADIAARTDSVIAVARVDRKP
jgi:environmental stress-induced protein Ves